MANKNLKKLAEQIGGNKLDRILSGVSGVFKKEIRPKTSADINNYDLIPIIVKVTASDMQPGYACYFIASDVGMAEKKAEAMTYQNPKGLEIPLDDHLRNERYFKGGLEHAKNHKPCGNPSCDAFLICYKHDTEKESKESIRQKKSDEEQKKSLDERLRESIIRIIS